MEINLRPWNISDLDNLVKFGNNFKIASNLTDTFPYPLTYEAGTNFITKVSADSPAKVFAVVFNGDAIGSIGLFPQSDIFKKNAELGYWIAEPYWGKGIATKAILLIVDYGFKTFDLTRIFARPFGSNRASAKALEKAGFSLEARLKNTIFKNGVFQDELIFGILNH
ncbi:MAG: GNAT family N-acetyltransferase [Bacteroidetes bacterium]|nr:GNAT family N-acetyltransferase [Bacteroidota bacterium]